MMIPSASGEYTVSELIEVLQKLQADAPFDIPVRMVDDTVYPTELEYVEWDLTSIVLHPKAQL